MILIYDLGFIISSRGFLRSLFYKNMAMVNLFPLEYNSYVGLIYLRLWSSLRFRVLSPQRMFKCALFTFLNVYLPSVQRKCR